MNLARVEALPGVVAVCRFRDDGSLIEAAGQLPAERTAHLARFAHWYRRAVSGNTDLLSLLSQMPGWSPSQGWIVRGASIGVCSVGNLVCLFEHPEGAVSEIVQALNDAARG